MHLYQRVLRYVLLNFAYKIDNKKHLENLEWGIKFRDQAIILKF